MTKKLYGLSLIIIILLTSFNYDSEKIFYLGKRTCKILTVGQDDKLAKFISLHENENTAVESFVEIKSSLPSCKLYQLKQNGERLLKYVINGKDYLFDPNRIFSSIGIKGTISKYNKTHPQELENCLSLFADSLLKTINLKNPNCYIVAIHNNTDNDFSILSYKNSKDAEEVYINKDEDIDNFFIVTTKSDFDYFKSKNRNVALQSENAIDDGSLSIYCQKNKIPYINIENQHGQKEEQIKKLKETYSLIKSKIK
jgi:hypothetical protein